jgi:phosphoribosyl-ATP pyrophosphohydrolase
MSRIIAPHEAFNDVKPGQAPLALGGAPLGRTDPVAEPKAPCAGPGELDRLYAGLAGVTGKTHPRTARLLDSGRRRAAQKVIEEAGEVALEAVKGRDAGIVRESADLLYHLVVLWRRAHIDPVEVYSEMHRRADDLGIAEKLPKGPRRGAARQRPMSKSLRRR